MYRPLHILLLSLLIGITAALFTYGWLMERTETLRSLQAPSGPFSYAEAVAAAAPAVVNIYTTKVTIERDRGIFNDPLLHYFFGDLFADRGPHRYRERRQSSLGSGVIVDQKGYILTNNHVIEGAEEIRVGLFDGRVFAARVAGRDPDSDLALLLVEARGLPVIAQGDSDRLRVGDVALAIGNPFGVGQTVTMGIVSATGRSQLGISTFENLIQTDAAINPGNSGGALINARGELIGINTAIFSRSGGSMGIGFAIPINLAQGVMSQLLQQGRVVRGWLGLSGQTLTPELAQVFGAHEGQGVLITGVLRDGPADQAGLEPGDIILRINKRVPVDVQQVLAIISELPPGSEVEIVGLRDGERFHIRSQVIERPRLVQ